MDTWLRLGSSSSNAPDIIQMTLEEYLENGIGVLFAQDAGFGDELAQFNVLKSMGASTRVNGRIELARSK